MSAEYDLWTSGVCLDPCCIIDGQGDPTPESGHGAIPADPDADGHIIGYSGILYTAEPTCGYSNAPVSG